LIGTAVQSDFSVLDSFDFPDSSGSISGMKYARVDSASLDLEMQPLSHFPELSSQFDDETFRLGVLVPDIIEELPGRQAAAARNWLISAE
jgi:hypothetical protein